MSSLDSSTGADGSNEVADAYLVDLTRSGDAAAFGELWNRHYHSGISVARSITSKIDPDDLVQEAYTRIFQAIQRGGGPTGAFRAYLFSSIRNAAASWGRSNNEHAIDELDTVADPESTDEAADEALDRGLTHRAFRSLPTRWQEVLWYTEIEQMKPAAVAPILGMKPVAVSQLAARAREGLREAWITAHLASLDDGSTCQWVTERLASYSRGTVSARDKTKIDDHLAECARCTIVASEAQHVSRRLALVLLPLTVGATGSAAYLAGLQGGGASMVALAAGATPAMPGAVMASAALPLPANITALFGNAVPVPAVPSGDAFVGVGASAGGAGPLGGGISGAGISGGGITGGGITGGGIGGGAGGNGAGGAGAAGGGAAAGGAATSIATVIGIAAAGALIAGAAIGGTAIATQQQQRALEQAMSSQNGGDSPLAAQIDATPSASASTSPSPSDLPTSMVSTPPVPTPATSPTPQASSSPQSTAPSAPEEEVPAPPMPQAPAEPSVQPTVPAPIPQPVPTQTPKPSPTDSERPTPAPTSNPQPSPSFTASPSPFPSITPTPDSTPSPTPDPSPDSTPSPEPTPDKTPSPEPTPDKTPKPDPTPTRSPSPSPSPTPTETAPTIAAPTSVSTWGIPGVDGDWIVMVFWTPSAGHDLVGILNGDVVPLTTASTQGVSFLEWPRQLTNTEFTSGSLSFALMKDGVMGTPTASMTPRQWDPTLN